MSTLRRPSSRWGLIPRTILFFAVILLAMGLFFGVLAGVAALRLAYEKRADQQWAPPAGAAAPATTGTSDTSTTSPTTPPAISVAQGEPQRVALWAMAATLRGDNIGFANKRKDLIDDWTDADSYAEWSLPAVAAGEYHVDLTYSAGKDEGGDFAVSVAGQTVKGRAASTVKPGARRKGNAFTTARLGTVKLPAGPTTATVKPVAPLERSLMSLLRVDLVPHGSDAAAVAVAVAPPPPVDDDAMAADDEDEDDDEDEERDRRRRRQREERELQERLKRARREEAERQRVALKQRRDEEKAARDAEKAAREGAGAVTGLVLIDTAGGRVLERLRHGMTLNLAALPRERLSVRADVRGDAKSVRFAHNGDAGASVEENAPWTIRGDDDGRTYNAWPLEPGKHTLTVTPFGADAAGGAAGKPMTVAFAVIDEPGRVPAGGTVTGFTLLDAERGAAVMTLTDDMTLDLKTVAAKRFTIRAEAAGTVGSVQITYAGPGGRREQRTENEAEFTLTDQRGASYDPFDLPPGRHKLSAVPFADDDAKGRRGREITITFDVPEK